MNILVSRQFRYFIKVMETRCLNKAAEALCITRSPLGKIIAELERRTGQALFIRRYNELIPTDAGLELYQRLRPLYDVLRTIEDEFSDLHHAELDIIFDVSVPVVLCNHYTTQMKSANLRVSTRRLDVTTENPGALLSHPSTLLISFRHHDLPPRLLNTAMPEEGLIIHMPSTLRMCSLFDPVVTGQLPLLRKKVNGGPDNFAGYMLHLLKECYAGLHFQETDDELAMMMYRVAAGNALVLMPERMADAFSFPGVRKTEVPGIRITLSASYAPALADSPALKTLLAIMAR